MRKAKTADQLYQEQLDHQVRAALAEQERLVLQALEQGQDIKVKTDDEIRQALIAKHAEEMLSPGTGAKVQRPYPWLTNSQYRKRIKREVLLSTVPGLKASAYPGSGGFHSLVS